MTTRTRDEVVTELQKLFVELDQLDPEPYDLDEGWMLQDWVAVQRWVRINEQGKLRGHFVITAADREMEDTYMEMYFREGMRQSSLGFASAESDGDDD